MRFSFTLIYLLTFYLSGCNSNSPDKEEYIIGTSLDVVSSLSDIEAVSTANIFDPTIRKIHSFDLKRMEKIQTFDVENPNDDHFVLGGVEGSYIIDLSKSQLSIYAFDGGVEENPIEFMGTPVSSAFDLDLGLLVVYDDISSVGLLKISPGGEVLDSWVGGPIVEGDNSILAGDISADGKLILSLSDDSIAVVDIEASLAQKNWVLTKSSVSGVDIKWLAHVGGDKILYQSNESLYLYDYATNSSLDSVLMPSSDVELYSKSKDPHVIYSKFNGNFEMLFASGSSIITRNITHKSGSKSFLQSSLDIANDRWSYIRSEETSSYVNKTRLSSRSVISGIRYINSYLFKRESYNLRLSDMLSISTKVLPNSAHLKQAGDSVFALYPSELGFAQKIDLTGGDVKDLKLFNIPYIKKGD